jgi:hypothetical protein
LIRKRDLAAAETIGAILLTAVIAASIAIVSYQWISEIPTSSLPYSNLEIACGNGTNLSDNYCGAGIISCPKGNDLSYYNCSKECSNGSTSEYQNCINNCGSPSNCIDPTNKKICNTIFICHKGGDPLNIKNLNIFINKNPHTFSVYYYEYNNTIKNYNWTKKESGEFNSSEIIKIPISDSPESVEVYYKNYESGRENLISSITFN